MLCSESFLGGSGRYTLFWKCYKCFPPPPLVKSEIPVQVHERMLEAYVKARKRFLKPGGLMLPTVGKIVMAPITDETLHQEQALKASFWDTQNYYGIDLST